MKLKDFRELFEKGDDEMEIPFGEEIPISQELPTTTPSSQHTINIKHSCNLGDIIAALPCVLKYFQVRGIKVKFLQRIDMPAAYYPGATHGTTDAAGTMVTLNQKMFDMVKPLVESQHYIDSMEVYTGQRVDLDFDVIRGKLFVNMPHGSIQAWLMYAWPDLDFDISQPWMFLPPQRQQIEEVTKGKVLINFTERYRNGLMEYHFLREYASELMFAGTEPEYFKFIGQWNLNIPRLEVNNFLELAYAIRGARFTLSNQSFVWNLATALGTPRILEVCQYAQNCMPFYGKHNYGYFHQVGLSYYFRKLFAEIK